MGRGSVLAALGFALAVALFEGSAGAGSDFEPECRFGLVQSGEAHTLAFSTRCNFEQTRVVVRPNRRVVGVDRTPSMSGAVDPEDGFQCKRRRKPSRVACRGRAGEDARLEGTFETRSRRCETETTISVDGGVDCEPGQACIAVAYGAAVTALKPRGC